MYWAGIITTDPGCVFERTPGGSVKLVVEPCVWGRNCIVVAPPDADDWVLLLTGIINLLFVPWKKVLYKITAKYDELSYWFFFMQQESQLWL